MHADALRHFDGDYFAENRALWERSVTRLTAEQFTWAVAYSHGSVRDQVLHSSRTTAARLCGWLGEATGGVWICRRSGRGDNARAHWG
ncbi:MAG: hypothetical protein OHK0015_45990 [Chloroflexi bacterium OHK40]